MVPDTPMDPKRRYGYAAAMETPEGAEQYQKFWCGVEKRCRQWVMCAQSQNVKCKNETLEKLNNALNDKYVDYGKHVLKYILNMG